MLNPLKSPHSPTPSENSSEIKRKKVSLVRNIPREVPLACLKLRMYFWKVAFNQINYYTKIHKETQRCTEFLIVRNEYHISSTVIPAKAGMTSITRNK